MASRGEKITQDNYMRPDEIDARNVARLLKIIDDWEEGKYSSLWRILHDVYEIMFTVNPLYWQNHKIEKSKDARALARGVIEEEQKEFSPYIKPVFLENPNSSEVRLALQEFKRHVDDAAGSLTSFAIAILIFDSVSVDGDGEHDASEIAKEEAKTREIFGDSYSDWVARYPNPFHRSIADLKVQEHHFKNPPQKVDLFHYDGPEPESAFRKRLEPHIAELRGWSQEQGIKGLIIGNITADASGSVAFRPHVFNYNFLRDCPEKDALFEREAENPIDFFEDRFFDFRVKEFNPDHRFRKEDTYPYPVVYVTTYAITFFPQHADDTKQLEALLKKAFEILGKVGQRFGNPIHYSSATKYKPPNPSWISAKGGSFAIKERVDLDGLYNLYYLLEDVIVPSATIARTLNAATLLEARSPIKTADDGSCGEHYSVNNSPQIYRMGMITQYGPSPLEQGLKDLLELYTLGEVDEKGFVQQTMNLAHMVGHGLITNQTETLLTFQETNHSIQESGGPLITETEYLVHLTKVFMKAMAGVAPNTPVESIGNMILQAVARRRDEIVARLQAHDKNDMDRIFNRPHRECSIESIFKMVGNFEEEREKALTISDALSGHNPNYYQGKDNERAAAIAKSSAYRLVARDPEIEPCIARNFDGTPYTSRMSGDPFPRIALPSRLQRFLDPEHTPVAQQALLSFGLK